MRGAVSGGEGGFEGGEAGAESEAAGAKCVEYEFFFSCPDHGTREGDHDTGVARARAGSIPASSESTSASQLASMMFSDTPIEPHV